MQECYHCGRYIDIDSDDLHTDEPSPGYFVESCWECCTICAEDFRAPALDEDNTNAS